MLFQGVLRLGHCQKAQCWCQPAAIQYLVIHAQPVPLGKMPVYDVLDTSAARFSAFPGQNAFGTLPEGKILVPACSNMIVCFAFSMMQHYSICVRVVSRISTFVLHAGQQENLCQVYPCVTHLGHVCCIDARRSRRVPQDVYARALTKDS